MQASSGKIILTCVTDKKLPVNVSISIGFPSHGINWFVYRKLIKGEPCGCKHLSNGSEITSLAYAIYDNIREKLIGTPLAQVNSAVSSVKCNCRNNEFSIHLICSNNFTAIKKAVGLTVKSIVPHKLYDKYCASIVLLNGKPSRPEFVNVVNTMVESMMLNIIIVGKYNIDQTKVDNMVETFSNKFNILQLKGSTSIPVSLSYERSPTSYPTIKASSYDALIIVDFITSSTNTNALICDNHIIIYDEKKIPHIDQKMVMKYSAEYEKMGTSIVPILIYNGGAIHNIDTFSLISLMHSNITPLSIKKILAGI